MKKTLFRSLIFSTHLFYPMHQPKSLKELAHAKITQQQLDTKLLVILKQSSWKVLKDDAAQYQHNLDIIENLLAAGANPNYIDPEIKLPLLYHAGACIEPYIEWYPDPKPEKSRHTVLKLLLSHGANPNLTTPTMRMPFLWSVKKNIHLARLLLEYKANPNQALPHYQDHPNETLLFDLCAYTNGEPIEIAELLLQYGADPLYPRNSNARKALDNARELRNDKLLALYEKGGMQKIA